MKYILAFILLTTLCCSRAVAQVHPEAAEKKKKEKTWRKPPPPPNATISAAWAPVEIEHYIGIRGGYGLGMARFEPRREGQNFVGLYNAGISYRLDIPSQKYVGCIEFDLEYLEKGYKYETYKESGVVYQRKFSSISLPIIWQPYIPFTKTGETRFYLNAGPVFGYALESHEKQYIEETNEVIFDREYKYDQLKDNRLEYGVTLGAGFIVAIKKRVTIGIDARYNIMLSDTFKGVNKYPSNPFRSPVDHINVSLRVDFKLHKTNKNKKNEPISRNN